MVIPIGICLQALLISAGLTTLGRVLAGSALYGLILLGSAGIAQIVTKKPALGQGDIRATPGFALLCATYPFEALAATALSIGLAFIVFRCRRIESLTESMPFGPFLTIGAAIAMIASTTMPF